MELNRKSLFALAAVLTLDVAFIAAPARHLQKETRHGSCCTQNQVVPEVHKSFKLSGDGDLRVGVVDGQIHIVADSPGVVTLVVRETVRGDSDSDLAQAKRDFTLDTEQQGDEVAICVNGPGNGHGSNDSNPACHGNGGFNWTGDRHESAEFDLELHVPPRADVNASSVNGGVSGERLAGQFALHSVNGSVEVRQATGAGAAATVNGDVTAAFSGLPAGDLKFSSVNGSLHLYFPPGLNAHLKYSTLNGQVYTDFPVSAGGGDDENGMRRLTHGHSGSGVIGSGGVALTASTINGTIYFHKQS